MPLSSVYLWFLQALNVMNVALELHRNSLHFASLLSRAEAELRGCELNVAIVEKGSSRPLDYVTIRMQQGGFVVVSHARAASRIDWRVTRRYLVDVARNPRTYLDNPERLDFRWLQKRLGLPPQFGEPATSQPSIGASDQPG